MNEMIIIDRFEEEFALCEKDGGELIKILKELLPPDAKDGDVVEFSVNRYVVNRDATEERRKTVEDKFFGLFNQ